MIQKIWPLVLLCSMNAYAANGPGSSGGGDPCEDRIKGIRDDLKAWIVGGGPIGLSLPTQVSIKQCSDSMLTQLDNAKIQCVGIGDDAYPVRISATPKVCRFDLLAGQSKITCDIEKFGALLESDQYLLIHHEYAGLAGIERPHGDDSDYSVSNQLSGFLTDQTVKKLAIKKVANQTLLDRLFKGTEATPEYQAFVELEILRSCENCGFAAISSVLHLNGLDATVPEQENSTYQADTLKEALVLLAATEGFRFSPITNRAEFARLFELYSQAPELATGLTNQELVEIGDYLNKMANAKIFKIDLTFHYEGGQISVRGSDHRKIAQGKTLADAFRAAMKYYYTTYSP